MPLPCSLLHGTQVYGLHDNANISMDLAQSQQMLDTLILTGGERSGGSSGVCACVCGREGMWACG